MSDEVVITQILVVSEIPPAEAGGSFGLVITHFFCRSKSHHLPMVGFLKEKRFG
jgi:hypothetical protein